MEVWQILLLPVYVLSLALLMGFSFHRFVIVWLYFRHADRVVSPRSCLDAELPAVTVQLPIYNEQYVVERLIRAVAAMDYPPDRLQIQVLDDSTDETCDLAKRVTAELRSVGVDIEYLHRQDRTGYKAGALAEGMDVAKHDLLAVFDADFLPGRAFLKEMTPHFLDRPDVGMVQARWGHLNRDYSLLTKVQSIFLDGHFVMEHGARSRAGLFFNFNGTAGIWRKRCIVEAGGWQHDTLTEDLDLSYRAQLAGWKFVYLPHVVAPAEVPVTTNAWKSQQFRWAKGSVQTAKKLLPRVMRSDLAWNVKAEAAVHLCANTSYLLMAILALLVFPAVLSRQDLGFYRVLLVDLPLFVSATAVVSRFYIHSQKQIYPDWSTRMKYIPCALALGMGISLNNARGVVEALVGYETDFKRTPKYNVTSTLDTWRHKRYGVSLNSSTLFEVALGIYLAGVIGFCVLKAIYFPLLFLFLFCTGFLYVGITSLLQDFLGRLGQIREVSGKIETAAADYSRLATLIFLIRT